MNKDIVYVRQCLKEAMSDIEPVPLNPLQLESTWQKFEALTAKHPLRKVHTYKWMAYAAAIIIILLSSTLFLYHQRMASSHQNTIAYQRIQAKYGHVQHISLPDGSQLTLFPGTVIDIPQNFNQVNRQVFLSGRAYFEVAHNKQKPFYVSASKILTRVLGTSFEVNAGKNDAIATVILRTGRVSISKQHQHLAVLSPGQRFTYHQVSGQYNTDATDPEEQLAWVNGTLNFNQTNFAELCQELEKWYHIRIEIENKQLLKKRITAGFKDQSYNEVLDILSATAGFKYQSENQIIHIF